jgi:hypothetical protein
VKTISARLLVFSLKFILLVFSFESYSNCPFQETSEDVNELMNRTLSTLDALAKESGCGPIIVNTTNALRVAMQNLQNANMGQGKKTNIRTEYLNNKRRYSVGLPLESPYNRCDSFNVQVEVNECLLETLAMSLNELEEETRLFHDQSKQRETELILQKAAEDAATSFNNLIHTMRDQPCFHKPEVLGGMLSGIMQVGSALAISTGGFSVLGATAIGAIASSLNHVSDAVFENKNKPDYLANMLRDSSKFEVNACLYHEIQQKFYGCGLAFESELVPSIKLSSQESARNVSGLAGIDLVKLLDQKIPNPGNYKEKISIRTYLENVSRDLSNYLRRDLNEDEKTVAENLLNKVNGVVRAHQGNGALSRTPAAYGELKAAVADLNTSVANFQTFESASLFYSRDWNEAFALNQLMAVHNIVLTQSGTKSTLQSIDDQVQINISVAEFHAQLINESRPVRDEDYVALGRMGTALIKSLKAKYITELKNATAVADRNATAPESAGALLPLIRLCTAGVSMFHLDEDRSSITGGEYAFNRIKFEKGDLYEKSCSRFVCEGGIPPRPNTKDPKIMKEYFCKLSIGYPVLKESILAQHRAGGVCRSQSNRPRSGSAGTHN